MLQYSSVVVDQAIMIRKRQSIKRKEEKKIVAKINAKFGEFNYKKIEIADFEGDPIYFFDNQEEIWKSDEVLIPILSGRFVKKIPNVIVDMGAIPFVCNGADVMAPGIVNMGSFEKNQVVAIRDETHNKALAIGKSLKSSKEISKIKKGKVIKNLHFVGDKLWNVIS